MTQESLNVLSNLLNKPTTKNVEYSAMTKAEKISYFTANFANEINQAKKENVSFTFAKIRTYKREIERTNKDTGKREIVVNDDYCETAFRAVLELRTMMSADKYTELSKLLFDCTIGGGRKPEIVEIPFRKAMNFDEFSQCDADFITWCEIKLGKPANGLISVSTGYGRDLYNTLIEMGCNPSELAKFAVME